jgi:hypothetical protein
MPFNPAAKNSMLDALDESGVTSTIFVTHIGIHTLTDPGLGTNANAGEATGGSPAYARQAVTWGAAASSAKANSAALTFDVPAGTYGFFTMWNVGTTANTNNYRGYIPFGGASVVRGFYSTDTVLTNDQLFSVAHGLADGDRVQLRPVYSEAISTGLTAGQIYFVVASAANTFKVSLTSGGAAVDITALGGGEGYFEKVVPEIFGAQGQITVAIGALSLDLLAM